MARPGHHVRTCSERSKKRGKRSFRCCGSRHTREGGSSRCRWKDRIQVSEKCRIKRVIVCGRGASRNRHDGASGDQWSQLRRLHNLWNRCKVHNRYHRDHNLQHCHSVFKVGKIFTWPARYVGEQKDGLIARTVRATGEFVKTACNR